jgi:hypothetical protein
MDLGVDLTFANPSCDELGVLRSEVQDENLPGVDLVGMILNGAHDYLNGFHPNPAQSRSTR